MNFILGGELAVTAPSNKEARDTLRTVTKHIRYELEQAATDDIDSAIARLLRPRHVGISIDPEYHNGKEHCLRLNMYYRISIRKKWDTYSEPIRREKDLNGAQMMFVMNNLPEKMLNTMANCVVIDLLEHTRDEMHDLGLSPSTEDVLQTIEDVFPEELKRLYENICSGIV